MSDPPEISEIIKGVSDKLLKHNMSNQKHPWDFYQKLDFDIVHETGEISHRDSKATATFIKPYFYHTEFSRPLDERRIVFHLRYNTYQGTEWDISFPVQVVMKGYQLIKDGTSVMATA